MKILLAALNAKYVHSNLAVYNLEAYANEQLHRDLSEDILNKDSGMTEETQGLQGEQMLPQLVVREYTINHNLDSILQSIYQEKAAVVAFSCYVWNVHEILTVARELHKIAPDIRIWLGGPEVSYNSRQMLEENSFIEGIIRGEGEVTFYELVKCWSLLNGILIQGWNWNNATTEVVDYYDAENFGIVGLDECDGGGCVYTEVAGVSYRDHQQMICENTSRPLMDLSDVPFVYQDLSQFENRILYYETSRGCPFSCSYCLSSIDKSVRFRDWSLVEKELQFFLDNKVSQVKFIDRTFNCNREHAMAIWHYITEHDNGVTNFHFEVSADLLGEEELSLFATMRPGLIQLEIGLQSTNPNTIKEIRRSMNIDRLKQNMLAIHSMENIHQHLDLIAGLPYEDYITFIQSFNDAYEMKPDQLQLGFLKVLKGSYMEEQVEKYGLQYQETQPYEVLSTNWISYDEILQLKMVEEMVEVYYNSNQFEHVLSYLVPLFESPFQFYESLAQYYKVKDLYGIGVKREARYEVLRMFCKERFGICDEIFVSLLTYDYYLRENAKSRPVWSPNEPIEKAEYHTFFKNGGNAEVRLDVRDDYDSKVAARAMHIEPVVLAALPWIVKEETKIFEMNNQQVYCLFDYDHRNSLTRNANVTVLSHL
ncbi:MAG: B12-binding domain-containing radical SAM protein [Lachnospiraceae bacterium]|nr:B12-binding domain-containing radical SAM protein [Lachnospiraceae bacterium]